MAFDAATAATLWKRGVDGEVPVFEPRQKLQRADSPQNAACGAAISSGAASPLLLLIL